MPDDSTVQPELARHRSPKRRIRWNPKTAKFEYAQPDDATLAPRSAQSEAWHPAKTSPARDVVEPAYLPGRASVLIRMRAWVIILCGYPFGMALAFESHTGSFQGTYEAIFGGLTLAIAGAGFGVALFANAKRRREIALGYVTTYRDAVKYPDTYWISPKNMAVMFRPGEPRPPKRGRFL